ncbi:MAG: F-box protein [Chlamydiales bacterium]|nr:F-box protein [Chlamydiales bacterium]
MTISLTSYKPNGSATNEIKLDPVQYLLPDICRLIFSKLSHSELVRCMSVSKGWQSLASDEGTWKIKASQLGGTNVQGDLQQLVENNKLSWKEVVQYIAKLNIIFELFQYENPSSERIRSNNPQFSSKYPPFNANIDTISVLMPRPYAKRGYYEFFITDSNNVTVKHKDNLIFTLKDTDRSGSLFFSHLALDGSFLFALRSDGAILQWNYETGILYHEHQTAWSKGDQRLCKAKRESNKITNYNGFHVDSGFIVLAYGNASHPFMEIISHRDLRTFWIENQDICFPHSMQIDGENLFVQQGGSLFVWNLSEGSHLGTIFYDEPGSHMAFRPGINKNKIWTWTTNSRLHVHQRESLKLISIHKTQKMGDACFGIIKSLAFLNNGWGGIDVIDLNKNKFVFNIQKLPHDQLEELNLLRTLAPTMFQNLPKLERKKPSILFAKTCKIL